jgi:hypothetical protein
MNLYQQKILMGLWLFLAPMLIAMSSENKNWQESYFTLQEREFQKMLLSYANADVKEAHSITWTVAVLRDGWGDLANLLQAVKIFKDKYPTWPIRAIIGLQAPSGNKPSDWFEQRRAKIPFDFKQFGLSEQEILILPYEFDKHDALWIGESDDAIILQRLIDGEVLDKLASKNTPKLREFADFYLKSSLVINISVFFPLSAKRFAPDIFLSEYGAPVSYFMPSYLFNKQSFFKMGLGPDCLGIFNLQPKIADNFDNEILKKYFTKDSYNFFKYKGNLGKFWKSLISIYPEVDTMTIVANDGLGEVKKLLHISEIKEEAKIIFVDKLGKEIVLNAPEKYRHQLIFPDVFPLSHADFLRASSMAKPPIGLTGNASFSESLDHLPYYYQENLSTEIFFDQIIKLAKHALVGADDLILFLQENQAKDSGKMGTPESLPQIEAAWAILVNIIRTHWDIKPRLLGLINMRISQKARP